MRLLAYLRQKEANTIKQQLEKKTIKKASTRKKTGKAPGLNEAFPGNFWSSATASIPNDDKKFSTIT